MNQSRYSGGAPFTREDAERAREAWGANCGPGALAAVLGLQLDAVRTALPGFDEKRYTNPAMMKAALVALVGDRFHWRPGPWNRTGWPIYGLARVQWEGPWTRPGVPMRARYRHTHWVGARIPGEAREIFDINCICVGGWVPLPEWEGQVVPWLLRQVEPRADGGWHITHTVDVGNLTAARGA